MLSAARRETANDAVIEWSRVAVRRKRPETCPFSRRPRARKRTSHAKRRKVPLSVTSSASRGKRFPYLLTANLPVTRIADSQDKYRLTQDVRTARVTLAHEPSEGTPYPEPAMDGVQIGPDYFALAQNLPPGTKL